jgi:predicted GNAT family acetyltransferase
MVPSTPPGWRTLSVLDAIRFVAPATLSEVASARGAEVVRLGAEDGPEMLDLAERTDPGPFRARTLELGGFVGVRQDGRLVAMAGQRIQPPGWSEITAVCTDPSVRGQGLGATVVRAVNADVAGSGRRSFLHVMRANAVAIGLYERLGFTPHEDVQVRVVRPPRV